MSTMGTIVMIAAGVGAVVGIRKSKSGAAWGRPVAVVCACLTLALAAMGILSSRGGGAKGMMEAAIKYNAVCGETLGNHLAKKFSGSRVLILVPPTMRANAFNDPQHAILEGLKKGMGTALTVVDTVALEPPENVKQQLTGTEGEEDEMMFELLNYEMWFTTRVFADILAQRKGTFDLLVSTIGLPADFEDSNLADLPDLPEIAVLNAPSYRIKDLVAGGTLDAVVLYNANKDSWKSSHQIPADIAEAFAERFFLLTTENVSEMAAAHPDMF